MFIFVKYFYCYVLRNFYRPPFSPNKLAALSPVPLGFPWVSTLVNLIIPPLNKTLPSAAIADSIDLSTDLKRYIKFNIKNNPDELKKLLEQ